MPEKPDKEIKIEKDDNSSTAVVKYIDVEEVKKLIFAANSDYDKIQFELRMVRTNMGRLMDKITGIEKSMK